MAAALLAFVGGSASAAASDIRLGQVVVEARFLEISVINTGTTSLDSLVAGFPTGTVVTSVSSANATFCAVSNENNGALCLYRNGWGPNTTKTLNLELTAPLAIGAKVVVCSGNSCVDVMIEGPCECTKIDGETELTFLGVTDRPINLWIDLDWKLRCTGGEGECAGEIEVLKPKRRTDILAVSKQRLGCKGDCDTIRGGRCDSGSSRRTTSTSTSAEVSGSRSSSARRVSWAASASASAHSR